jgi:DNA repair exonuclease SbcCD ATPase subunit
MIKRVILGSGVAFVLALVFFGRDALSYVRTSIGCVKESVHNSVPIEFQLERARRMIKDLEPEVRKNMHLIAKEEVEVEKLQKHVSDLDARLEKEEAELKKLHADVKSGKTSFEYGGRKYSAEQVRADLASRFERLKTGQATLKSLREICSARTRGLDAARQKLEGMLAARRQLKVDVENLEARLQMVAAAQATSNYSFDDSQLGRVKELVTDLRTRLDVAEKLVGAEAIYHDEIPVNQTTPANIVDQVSEYLSKTAADGQAAANPSAEAVAKSK